MTSQLEEIEKKNIQLGSKKLNYLVGTCVLIVFHYLLINYKIIVPQKIGLGNLAIILLLGLGGAIITFTLIPTFMEMMLKRKIFGIDINKVEDISNEKDPNRKIVPEGLGVVPSLVFIVVMIFYMFLSGRNLNAETLSSFISIIFMVLLGFIDDVLDLRWRHKLVLSAIASIPLIMTYQGNTTINVPNFLSFSGNGTIDFGFIYLIYVSMLSIFCTNSINIYAGINGLEVGQSIVIGFTMVLYNFILLVNGSGNVKNITDSLAILIMFLGSSLILFYYNKYPSKCFIGDTYCYFSGATLGAAAIIGGYDFTVLLFFIPQLLNFILSIPQLLGIIPCPRHRLPKYNHSTRKLESKVDQLTLLNQGLRILGPTREQDLCNIALLFQIVCSTVGLAIRIIIYPKLIS